MEIMYLVQLSLVTVIIITCLLYLYFIRRFNYWKNRGIYAQTPTFPFGNAKDAFLRRKGVGEVFKDIYDDSFKKLEKCAGFYFLSKPILVLVDLDLCQSIFKTDFEYFTDRVFHSQDYDPLSAHLGALKGEQWKKMRLKLSPAFTPAKIKMMFHIINNCVDQLMSVLDDAALNNEAVEMKHLITRYSIDVIVSSSFGIECNTINNRNLEFIKTADAFWNSSLWRTVIRLLTFVNPNLLGYFQIKFVSDDITNFFLNTTEKIVKYRENNNVIRKDLLHLLLQIRNNIRIEDDDVGGFNNTNVIDHSLSITEIAAQCFIFFFAGYETTSSAITFCLYEISLNEELQEKAREEVRTVHAKHNGEFNSEAIGELSYVDKCLKESLRKYPTVPILTRECNKNYTNSLTGIKIEKGTVVVMPALGIHRNPQFYPEPDVFDPERFSPENSNNRHPCAYIPFGYGPRNCIAYQFGLMEAKVVMAKLLLNYKFQVKSSIKTPIVIDPTTFVLRSDSGIWLNIEKIKV
ncbi:hypothetical protein FQR65_LT08883 [Abscondita terminalis]|nr:hypothetical protein FQR65_LT08883 [Abscondita terminalis]